MKYGIARSSLSLGIGLLALMLAATAADAQYQYSFLEYPEASVTAIRGIDDDGDVVGKYVMSSSGPQGFEYSNGQFLSIQQDGPAVVFRGVNDSGTIVGYSSGQGFVYSSGVYTPITVPGSTGNVAIGINDAGDIVGEYYLPDGGNLGYVDVGGTFTTVEPPTASSTPGSVNVVATGINNNNEIVGYYTNSSGQGLGFTDVNGVYSDVYVAGSTYTGVLGLNDSGTVVGFYGTSSGAELPFLESNGVYTLLDVPGQTSDTDATGINNAGTIVGYNSLPNGNSVGFVTNTPLTLSSLQGGTTSDPTLLPPNESVGDLMGSIGGQGSMQVYKFDWLGGSFEATLSLTGANSDGSYLFEILDANGDVIETLTLDQLDGFIGTLSGALGPGDYEIGLIADSPQDPAFNLQFVTPVGGVPEPATWAMLALGLAGVGATLRSRRARRPMGC